MFLQLRASGQEIDFRVVLERSLDFRPRPFLLELNLSAEAFNMDTKAILQVDGTRHHHQVDLKDWVSRSGHGAPQYIVAMSPLYGALVTPQLAVQLLRQHMRWHLAMGFNSYLVYCRRHLLSAYLEEAWIVSAIQAGKLRIVLWNEWVIQGDIADQTVVFNHAILSHWTAPEDFLLTVDIDEYFATGVAAPIATVMQHCFSHYSLLQFPRYDTTVAVNNELRLWSQPKSSMHPLEPYCVRHNQADGQAPFDPQPKYLARASSVYSCDIHGCAVQQGLYSGQDEAAVLECGDHPFIMHLYNLFTQRFTTNPKLQHHSCYDKWKWVLPHLEI